MRNAVAAAVLFLLIPQGCKTHAPSPAGGKGNHSPAAPVDAESKAHKGLQSPLPANAVPTPVPKALAQKYALVPFLTGLQRPVDIDSIPGDRASRIFVVEQVGRIRLADNGRLVKKPVLDIRQQVSRANEQGLLGLAFHPKFATNRTFFINYTSTDGTTIVASYQMGAGHVAIPASRKQIFRLKQPFANHNGGNLAFGPDGKLYIGTGDGGAGGDPLGSGQDDDSLLGKMLRVDVDVASPSVEIVHKGLRNPWRYSFDPKTGDLYIADVGQNEYEEINVVPAGDTTRHNFGWRVLEGKHCYDAASCVRDGMTMPVVEYKHSVGCSITGGVTYRGKRFPALQGAYFYADFCQPYLFRSFRWTPTKGVHDHWDWRPVLGEVPSVAGFGTDTDGELYVASLSGVVYQLIARRQ